MSVERRKEEKEEEKKNEKKLDLILTPRSVTAPTAFDFDSRRDLAMMERKKRRRGFWGEG